MAFENTDLYIINQSIGKLVTSSNKTRNQNMSVEHRFSDSSAGLISEIGNLISLYPTYKILHSNVYYDSLLNQHNAIIYIYED